MNKNRLEAFSDGVFAIVITLLILNVKVPDVHIKDNGQLNHIIFAALPKLLSFGFSFLVIGIFWIAHHRIFSFAKVVDTPLLWLNLVYLMFNALVPFPASILADNFFLPTTILIYTGTLFLISLMHFIILEYIIRNEDVKHEALTKSIYRSAIRSAVTGPVCFLLAGASCFISAYLSLFFYSLRAVFFNFHYWQK